METIIVVHCVTIHQCDFRRGAFGYERQHERKDARVKIVVARNTLCAPCQRCVTLDRDATCSPHFPTMTQDLFMRSSARIVDPSMVRRAHARRASAVSLFSMLLHGGEAVTARASGTLGT